MMICFASSTIFAQEVRGVESKLVVYDGPKYRDSYTEYYGYSFLNMNSIPVSVDVELYEQIDDGTTTLISTKSFVLQANESYIWKHEDNNAFRVHSRYSSTVPHYYRGNRELKYYVKYKAYKLL